MNRKSEDPDKCGCNCKPKDGPFEDSISYTPSNDFTYSADHHNVKKSKILDIVIKEMDYGYLVKVGSQSLCIETQTKLITWLDEYIKNPDKITKKWDAGYYHVKEESITLQVGVLAESVTDFLSWKERYFDKNIMVRRSPKRFTIESQLPTDPHNFIEYICMASHSQICGWSLDKIIETPHARNNKNYEQLKLISSVCIKSKK